MRWFKHMTNSIDDEKISRLVDECGLEGYGFFWRVLELIAAQVDDDGKNYCSYSKRAWCNKLAIKHQTWSKLIASCEQAGLFEVSDDGQTITVKSPNILKYRDEWSRKKAKNSGVSPEKLRSDSGVSRARFSSSKEEEKTETETDTDTEEEINTHPLPLASEGEAAGLVSGSTSDCAGDSDRAGEETPSQPQAISPPSGLPAEGSLFAPPGKRADSTNPRSQGTNQRARRTPSAGNSAANLRAAMEAYTCNAELRQALEGFRVMRERLRKPLTARAFQLTCAELDKLAGNDEALKARILDQSVQRGWQGVFPLKAETVVRLEDRWAGAI